mmetsp:Transcript_34754/g.74026  ORF Transcript_34754/g.74026 Transcript_34754/m.74026 type:complete len:109 (-) Transcript_34754:469-795(-)
MKTPPKLCANTLSCLSEECTVSRVKKSNSCCKNILASRNKKPIKLFATQRPQPTTNVAHTSLSLTPLLKLRRLFLPANTSLVAQALLDSLRCPSSVHRLSGQTSALPL